MKSKIRVFRCYVYKVQMYRYITYLFGISYNYWIFQIQLLCWTENNFIFHCSKFKILFSQSVNYCVFNNVFHFLYNYCSVRNEIGFCCNSKRPRRTWWRCLRTRTCAPSTASASRSCPRTCSWCAASGARSTPSTELTDPLLFVVAPYFCQIGIF